MKFAQTNTAQQQGTNIAVVASRIFISSIFVGFGATFGKIQACGNMVTTVDRNQNELGPTKGGDATKCSLETIPGRALSVKESI